MNHLIEAFMYGILQDDTIPMYNDVTIKGINLEELKMELKSDGKMSLKDLVVLKNKIDDIINLITWGMFTLKTYDRGFPNNWGVRSLIENKGWEQEEHLCRYNLGGDYRELFSEEYFPDKERYSNYDCLEIIRNKYEEIYGKDHKINFDEEYSYSYVYTNDTEEAKRYIDFMYDHFITPMLNDLKKLFKIESLEVKDGIVTFIYKEDEDTN